MHILEMLMLTIRKPKNLRLHKAQLWYQKQDSIPTSPRPVPVILGLPKRTTAMLNLIIKLNTIMKVVYANQTTLGEMVGVGREQANRILGKLVKLGLIFKKKNRIGETCWFKPSSFFKDEDVQSQLRRKLPVFYYLSLALLTSCGLLANVTQRNYDNSFITTPTTIFPTKQKNFKIAGKTYPSDIAGETIRLSRSKKVYEQIEIPDYVENISLPLNRDQKIQLSTHSRERIELAVNHVEKKRDLRDRVSFLFWLLRGGIEKLNLQASANAVQSVSSSAQKEQVVQKISKAAYHPLYDYEALKREVFDKKNNVAEIQDSSVRTILSKPVESHVRNCLISAKNEISPIKLANLLAAINNSTNMAPQVYTAQAWQNMKIGELKSLLSKYQIVPLSEPNEEAALLYIEQQRKIVSQEVPKREESVAKSTPVHTDDSIIDSLRNLMDMLDPSCSAKASQDISQSVQKSPQAKEIMVSKVMVAAPPEFSPEYEYTSDDDNDNLEEIYD